MENYSQTKGSVTLEVTVHDPMRRPSGTIETIFEITVSERGAPADKKLVWLGLTGEGDKRFDQTVLRDGKAFLTLELPPETKAVTAVVKSVREININVPLDFTSLTPVTAPAPPTPPSQPSTAQPVIQHFYFGSGSPAPANAEAKTDGGDRKAKGGDKAEAKPAEKAPASATTAKREAPTKTTREEPSMSETQPTTDAETTGKQGVEETSATTGKNGGQDKKEKKKKNASKIFAAVLTVVVTALFLWLLYGVVSWYILIGIGAIGLMALNRWAWDEEPYNPKKIIKAVIIGAIILWGVVAVKEDFSVNWVANKIMNDNNAKPPAAAVITPEQQLKASLEKYTKLWGPPQILELNVEEWKKADPSPKVGETIYYLSLNDFLICDDDNQPIKWQAAYSDYFSHRLMSISGSLRLKRADKNTTVYAWIRR